MASAFYFFPFVGLLLGASAALIAWGLGSPLALQWPLGGAACAVAWLAWVSGGLHLDGLADTADGLAGGRTRERALEIMKDSRIGAMGAIAVTLVLLLKTVAVAQLADLERWRWIPMPIILSRLVQVQLAVLLPYARAEGGTGARYVKEAGMGAYVVATLSALAMCGLLAWRAGLFAWLIGSAAALCIGARLRTRLGGVTGDTLGFASEIGETLLFVALAMLASALNAWHWYLYPFDPGSTP